MAILQDRTERAERRRQFLTDAIALLASSLDYSTTLTSLAKLAVPQIADWCAIHIKNDDGSVSTVAVAHVDPAKVELARQLERRYPYDPNGAHGVPEVLRSGRSEVVREISDELLVVGIPDPELLTLMRGLGLRSSMCVPLKARGQILGAITLVSAESEQLFDEDDLSLAEDLASRAALAIDNARLFRQAQQEAERFRVTFEQAAVGMALVGLDDRFLLVNRRLCDLTGYSHEELLARTTHEISHPEDLPAGLEYSRRIRAGEIERWVREKRYIRKDGSILWATVSLSLARDLSGQPSYFVVAVEDITERKRADEALRETEQQFRLLFASNPHPMYVYDLESLQFLEVNDAAVAQYGYTRDKFLQMRITDIRPLEEVPRLMEELTRVWGDFSSSGQWRHQRRDGRIIDVEITSHTVTWGDRRAVLVLAQNITERKRAEEGLRRLSAELEQRVVERTVELESANQELEAFSYSVSHDLRAPLRSMDGFSQVLLERYADALDERGVRYLNHIRDASQEMGQLIDALLQLSRVTRGEMQREHFDLAALARSIEAQMRKTDTERDVTMAIADELVTTGDTGLLRVLLENLLGNAWKFTRKTAHACIELGRVASACGLDSHGQTPASGYPAPVYFVRDNGAGFDMAYADKLFAPFQRLHGTSEFEGTGIGLATVQRIVHRHGGRIWAEGAVGEGATFYFTLQRACEEAA